MREKFNNKYRTESIRLRGYDYRTPGWYFVTICTKNRKAFFGEIRNGIVGLSPAGVIAYQNWQEIPDHFDQVVLDEIIVMPNHIHGLIGITSEKFHNNQDCRDVTCYVSTEDTISQKMSSISPETGSLSVIIRSYKGSVTRQCRKNGDNHFKWQPKFHDHIVRNEKSLNRIREYIFCNPLNWEQDDYYIR